MRILAVNDDGIDSEGIRELVRVLSKKYEVAVAAPDTQRSAASHSVSYFMHDLRAEKRAYPGTAEAWAISGTPADCVYAALNGLCAEDFDLVISGINNGPNFGTDVFYSGTVAAAEEATILGRPAMAVSLNSPAVHYEDAASIVPELLEKYLNDPDCRNYTLNVNIPDLRRTDWKGILAASLDGIRAYGRPLTITDNPDGSKNLHCPNDTDLAIRNPAVCGDITKIKEGYVTLTALSLDPEHSGYQKKLESWYNH